MSKSNAILITLAAALCLAAAPARAAFEDLDAGPRASAMAGAYAAQTDGVSSVFYNPAGVIGVTKYDVSLAQQKMFMGLTDGSAISRSALAFGTPLEFGGSYWGSAAFGLDTLSVDSLYSETRMRLAWAYPLKENLWAGLALARMSVSYGSDSYTAANPVLASAEGASGMGLDLGAVYSAAFADLGLSIQNANEPDLGIVYPNKVSRKITLGAALRRPSYTFGADLAMAGSDMKIKAGVEVPVMRAEHGGKMLARGGFSIGSRDYRAVSAGFGYLFGGRYRVDYAFSYPLSGLAGTMGTHQLAFATSWGEPRGPMAVRGDQYAADGSEEKAAAGKGQGEGGGDGELKKTAPSKYDLERAAKLVREARKDFRTGAYAKSAASFKKADQLLMSTDPDVQDMMQKATAISAVLVEAVAPTEREDILRKAINRYADNNSDAVLYITYARQRWAKDIPVTRLYNLVSREFPERSSQLRILAGITIIDQLLQDALDFIRNGRFIQAISTLQQVLQLEPNNVPALTRMGSAYWAIEKKDIARQNWQKVLELDPNNTEVIQFMKMN